MALVQLARSAQTDLLEAWLFIAEDNPDAADHVLNAIDREANVLATQPLMGRARPELALQYFASCTMRGTFNRRLLKPISDCSPDATCRPRAQPAAGPA